MKEKNGEDGNVLLRTVESNQLCRLRGDKRVEESKGGGQYLKEQSMLERGEHQESV